MACLMSRYVALQEAARDNEQWSAPCGAMHTEAARAYATLEEKPTCMPALIRPPLLRAAYRVTADGVGHPFCSCIAAYMVLQHWKAQCCRGSLPIQASTGTALHFLMLLDGDGPPGAGCILSGVPYYAQHFGCEAAVLKHNRWLDQVLDCGLHADACAAIRHGRHAACSGMWAAHVHSCQGYPLL